MQWYPIYVILLINLFATTVYSPQIYRPCYIVIILDAFRGNVGLSLFKIETCLLNHPSGYGKILFLLCTI